jgi:hypothetical protein
MRVQLRLLRPRETPRSWKWELDFRLSIPARGSSTEVTVGSLRVYYIMSERLGLLRNGGRPRPHRFCEQQGYVFAAGQEQMRACGICKYKRDTLIHPKLITMRQNALILSSTAGDLFTWELPKEAVLCFGWLAALCDAALRRRRRGGSVRLALVALAAILFLPCSHATDNSVHALAKQWDTRSLRLATSSEPPRPIGRARGSYRSRKHARWRTLGAHGTSASARQWRPPKCRAGRGSGQRMT